MISDNRSTHRMREPLLSMCHNSEFSPAFSLSRSLPLSTRMVYFMPLLCIMCPYC